MGILSLHLTIAQMLSLFILGEFTVKLCYACTRDATLWRPLSFCVLIFPLAVSLVFTMSAPQDNFHLQPPRYTLFCISIESLILCCYARM